MQTPRPPAPRKRFDPQADWLLAIDTAGRGGTIALGRGDQLVVDAPLPTGRRHNVQLALGIQQALKRASITAQDLGAVAAALGPGSFTGIRVGVTTANTLAFALGIPALGVPSMDVLVQNTPRPPEPPEPPESSEVVNQQVAVALNVKRGSVYAGRFARSEASPTGFVELGHRALVPVEEVVSWGLPVIGEALEGLIPDELRLDESLTQGKASAVYRFARAQVKTQPRDNGAAVDDTSKPAASGGGPAGHNVSKLATSRGCMLVPLYVREPEAVTLWEARKKASPSDQGA